MKKRIYPLFLIIFITSNLYGTNVTMPYSSIIGELKKSVVLIKAIDIKNRTIQKGTGVLLYDVNKPDFPLILTCEHIIAKKNDDEKTIGLCESIGGFINTKEGKILTMPLGILHSDEKNDFAILGIYDAPGVSKEYDKSLKTRLQTSRWMKFLNIFEGDNVLYIGYPLELGEHKQNFPLSRIGIVSQLITENESILLDGFAQQGYSGSPVFVIRETGNGFPPSWEYFLIGIIKGYPNETQKVYKVKLQEQDSLVSIYNPGFTYVIPMDYVIKVIEGKIIYK